MLQAFLEILNMYRKGQKNIGHVYSEVAVLFQNHEDLLQEFTYFLPDNSQSSAQMRQYMRNPQGMPPAGMRGPPGMFPQQQRMGMPMQRQGMGMGMGGMGGSPHDHSRNVHKRKAARRAEEGFVRMDGKQTRVKPNVFAACLLRTASSCQAQTVLSLCVCDQRCAVGLCLC